jgi:hypothetical protein
MPPIDEPPSFTSKDPPPTDRRPKSAEAKVAKAEAAEPAERIVFTLEASSGKLIEVERVDAAGSRQTLSEEQRAVLANGPDAPTLQRLLEQAFEAGIDCLLGRETGEADLPESPEDAQLGSWLLRSLIARSDASRLAQPEVLQRAILGTLIEQAAARSSPAH